MSRDDFADPGREVGASRSREPSRADSLPIHTRSLEVEVFQPEPGRALARGRIIDLRKFGFVPTGGDLQSAGVIHNMSLEVEVDVASRVALRVEPAQAVVPFEASERTGGESCRDSIHRLRELSGERLDDAFSKKISSVYGGPLGCSHLLSLTHLMSTSVTRALDWEQAARGQRPAEREPGERLFKRCIVLDGFEVLDGRFMDVTVQFGDVFSAPYEAVDVPLDRFARQHEVRLFGRVDMSNITFAALELRERERAGRPLSPDGWVDRDALALPFVGGPAIYGLARQIDEQVGGAPERAAIRDTLRSFAPGMIQCMAAFAARMFEGDVTSGGALGEGPSILQLGGQADSCYIWREGGPGMRSRSEIARRRD